MSEIQARLSMPFCKSEQRRWFPLGDRKHDLSKKEQEEYGIEIEAESGNVFEDDPENSIDG